MIKNMKEGTVITDFIGGNSNPMTGDFSFGIIGLQIKDGPIIQAVNEMNITGNGKEFWNPLIETGNDPYLYSATRRPSMMFGGVPFSGL
jgi:PmbA protein